MGVLQDYTGRRFGRLIAQWPVGVRGVVHHWLCSCDCGNTVTVAKNSLQSNNTQSCGCLMREIAAKRQFKHGQSNHRGKRHASPTYSTWSAMHKRCENPKASDYAYYGGRGIKVCRRWRSFNNFLTDMGERPIGKTLDRYPDNNGNYEPTNCRWASPKEQRSNQREAA